MSENQPRATRRTIAAKASAARPMMVQIVFEDSPPPSGWRPSLPAQIFRNQPIHENRQVGNIFGVLFHLLG